MITDEAATSNAIRSELVDVATGFLQNPKIINEKMERKREFLQKKGLTDTEIHHAFQRISQEGFTSHLIENSKEIHSNHRPSFFRRLCNDLTVASLLVLAIKTIKHFYHSQNQSNENNELNEILKNLQTSVSNMQTSVTRLVQTADQLNTTIQSPNSNQLLFDELKKEIQGLKELFSGRSSNVC